METCIFCKIVKGEAPAVVVYDDGMVLAIADVNPVTIGHTLIITRQHYHDFFDISTESLQNVIAVAQKLAKLYRRELKAHAVNIVSASGKAAQQSVMHFHLHLIPRYENDGLNLEFRGDPALMEKSTEELRKLRGKLI